MIQTISIPFFSNEEYLFKLQILVMLNTLGWIHSIPFFFRAKVSAMYHNFSFILQKKRRKKGMNLCKVFIL